jgi:integrase
MEQIQALTQWFLDRRRYRDLFIFTIGLNVGLRAGDLLALKTDDILEDDGTIRRTDSVHDTSDGISVLEEKTSRHRIFFLNEACREVIEWYKAITGTTFCKGEYLFKSRNGGHISVDMFRKILKEAARDCGIKQNIGTHTLRKTFGYWQFMHHSGNVRVLAMLQRLFGHSSQTTTLRYIGISTEEDKRLYNNMCIKTINNS